MAADHTINCGVNYMSDNLFIDTNILLYAYDLDADIKHDIAKKLIQQCWKQNSAVVSIQVLCEFFVQSTRKGDSIISPEEAKSILRNLSYNWQVIIPDIQMVMEAIRGQENYQLSFWDALIWAAAKKAKVEKLYTEDFQHGQIVEGVKFINPFKVAIKNESSVDAT